MTDLRESFRGLWPMFVTLDYHKRFSAWLFLSVR